MHDGKTALATHPLAAFGENACIMQDGGLVEQYASAVNRAGERHLVGVKILKRRLAPNLIRLIPEDI